MARARDERHRYGQHYTPTEVARLLAAFAVRTEGDLVLDPSCGDGRLLDEALRLKHEISPANRRRSHSRQVFGADRSATAVELAARTGAQVAISDFFDIEPRQRLNESVILPSEFDAIIGNPPYIRQELMGTSDKRRIQKCLERDRVKLPDVYWPRWSGRSDIYVYFFAHAMHFLARNGRLVFLTASSWLDVGYGAALRDFLLKNFRVIAVIESGCESFFEDASINTAITVLEREPDAPVREANPIRFVQLTKPLAHIFSESANAPMSPRRSAAVFATSIEATFTSETFETHRIRVIHQTELATTNHRRLTPDDRPATGHRPPTTAPWGKFLRADEVFFRVLERGGTRLQPLADFARVRFGVKTGANEFFYVSERGQSAKSEARRAKDVGALRALSDVATVRRGLTTGANEFFYLTRRPTTDDDRRPTTDDGRPADDGKHSSYSPSVAGRRSAALDSRSVVGRRQSVVFDGPDEIEPRYLSPVIFSLKEIPGILVDRSHAKRLFFNCQLPRDELAGTSALDYIERGEGAGFHRRPTCASRDPWYGVAREMKPAPLIFPSKVGERWVVALNRAGVFEDKKLYGIFPSDGVSELALAALLNSTWARYYAEITCRQMTGAQAIADIDVAVAEQTMIPDPRELSLAIKKKLEAAVVKLTRRPVYSVFEEVKLADRRRLDTLTLEAIGFIERSERETVLDQLYDAMTELVRARLARNFVHR
jgi:SAM-dependent methyltransferase